MSSVDYDARKFVCSQEGCLKRFQRKSDLSRHERIHNDDRPYPCDAPGCGKAFIQRSALTVHTRTHTGEKPHQCLHEGCEKAFSDSSSLARHRRIHSGKRPYECSASKCGKSFCRKTTLTKHEKRSHDIIAEDQSPVDDESSSESEESPVTDHSPSSDQRYPLPDQLHQIYSPNQVGQMPPVKEEPTSAYNPYPAQELPDLKTEHMQQPVYSVEPYYAPPSAHTEYSESVPSSAQFSEPASRHYSQSYDESPTVQGVDTVQAITIAEHYVDSNSNPATIMPQTPIHELPPQNAEGYEYDQQDLAVEHVSDANCIGPDSTDGVPIMVTSIPGQQPVLDPSLYWPMEPPYNYQMPMPYNPRLYLTETYMQSLLYKTSENEPLLPSDRVSQIN